MENRAAAVRNRRQMLPPKHPKASVLQPAPPPAAPQQAEVKPAPEEAIVDLVEPQPTKPPEPAVRRRSRVRPTQVHLDEASEEHLTELKKRAVMADVGLTSSAVLRLALAELVERYSYDEIVELFAADASQPRPGRPVRS